MLNSEESGKERLLESGNERFEEEQIETISKKNTEEEEKNLLSSKENTSTEVENETVESTPLPKSRVALIGLILFANTFNIMVIFPFLPWMTQFFFPELEKTEIGYYAGYLGGAFNAGAFFGSLIWGHLSDQWGRRPVMLSGLLGTLFAITAFGFSLNYAMAFIARFMWGLLNGNVGVSRTYLSEICDDSNQAKAFSVMGIMGGIARIFAPVIGGYLSQPADKYSALNNDFFQKFPFVLPSFFGAAVCLVSIIWSYLKLNETLPSKIKVTEIELEEISPKPEKILSSELNLQIENKEETNQRNEITSKNNNERKAPEVEIETEEIELVEPERKSKFSKVCQNFLPLSCYSKENYSRVKQTEDERSKRNYIFLLKQQPILYTSLMYGFIGFAEVCFTEIFPLWLLNDPDHGGFNLDSDQVGLLVSSAGPFQLVAQLFLYHRLTDKFGFRKIFVASNLIRTAITFMMPWSAYANQAPIWVAYLIISILWTLARITTLFAMTSTFVLVNNSCYSEQRGTVNGIAQAMASIGRMIGPLIAGNLFAWSVSNGINWIPLNYHFSFYFIGICSLIPSILSFRLPESINKKKK